MTLVRWCVVGVALVALGGCGSSGSGGGTPPNLSDLASKAGCAVIPDSPSAYAAAEGSCDDLTLATFTSSDNRDNWLKDAEGVGGPYLVGDSWVVAGGEKAALERLKQSLGGELRN
jgi:hypothetical protein